MNLDPMISKESAYQINNEQETDLRQLHVRNGNRGVKAKSIYGGFCGLALPEGEINPLGIVDAKTAGQLLSTSTRLRCSIRY